MLKNKTAIITGGVRGIGFAITEELIKNGAKVVICSRTKSDLQKAILALNQNGKVAYGIVVDVSKFKDCEKLIKFAKNKLGSIDILVNNAGIFGPIGLLETNNPKAWQQALSVNILGAVYCSMLVLPYMKKQGSGKIINLAGAGVGGIKTLPRFSTYYTSKTAVVAFTENLASELEENNIQVNAISPGAVASDLTLSLLKLDESLVGEAMFKTSQKLKKDGGTSPKLAGQLVVFLSSNESNHISGRLLSTKWDKIENLKKQLKNNLYKLRRIDQELFYEK